MKHRFSHGLSPPAFTAFHYTEWGDPGNPRILVCAHGPDPLRTRFDTLAEAMQDRFRRDLPDVPGAARATAGETRPINNYTQYMNDMTGLLARVTAGGADSVHWLGTSMGGIIGMLWPRSRRRRSAAGDERCRIIHPQGLAGTHRHFWVPRHAADFESIVMAVRAVSPFAECRSETWRQLTVPLVSSSRWIVMFRYDPGMSENSGGRRT